MKLVSFSPWKHVTTSIPASKDDDGILYNFVPSLSTAGAASKRIKAMPSSSSKSAADIVADLALTSGHQISILGRTSSKKIPRRSDHNNDASAADAVKQIPSWVYSSRPGPKSSFLPNKKTSSSSSPIGAVVDPTTRMIYALQNNNLILKMWGMEDDVSGPDDNDRDGLIEKVEFTSPVVCLDAIPYRRNGKIKPDFDGGVTGLLSNGQVFVVLITGSSSGSKRSAKVGIFGEKSSGENGVAPSKAGRSSRRKKTNGSTEEERSRGHHLHSIVKYKDISENSVDASVGQKRKLGNLETTSGDDKGWGEVSLTTLSIDPKRTDVVLLHRYVLAISSCVAADKDDEHLTNGNNGESTTLNQVNATFSKEKAESKLPHKIYQPAQNGNGSKNCSLNKVVKVAQLDSTHVSIVYQDESKGWIVSLLDTQYGEFMTQPFPLSHTTSSSSSQNGNKSRDVLGIAGLTTAVLSVLTSDDIMTVYDVRRSVILHETYLRKLVGEDDKCSFGITSDFLSGRIGVICNRGTGKGKNGNASSVSVTFARIGLYDSSLETPSTFSRRMPFLKGSYNLARIISASMETTANKKTPDTPVVNHERNLLCLFPQFKEDSASTDEGDSAIIAKLEAFRGTASRPKNGCIGKSFAEVFNDFIYQKKETSVEEKKQSPKKKKGFKKIPQTNALLVQKVVEVSMSVAINIILSSSANKDDIFGATQVMAKCILSGKISGRTHIENVANTLDIKVDDVFRAVLFRLKRFHASKTEATDNASYPPITLICLLLQHCQDSLSEHILVSMLHFVLCHTTPKLLRSHWNSQSKLKRLFSFYDDAEIKTLEKRLDKAVAENEISNDSERGEELQKLMSNLEQRLAAARQIFLIGKIITNSQCNVALLRTSLRYGLTQSNAGEIEVLMQVLMKLLRKAGREKRVVINGHANMNRSTCISQWLSALIDANLGTLILASNDETMEHMKREVSSTVKQTQAIISLSELMGEVEDMVETNTKSKKNTVVSKAPIPLYGIESLIF